MTLASRVFVVTVLGSICAVACKSTDKGAATGATITDAANQIENGIRELDGTVRSLHVLVDKPAPDLTVQRRNYEENLARLEGIAKQVTALASDMEKSGQEYFTQWNEQLASIKNEDIRERSADRRKAIEASFSKLKTEYGEAKDMCKPLMDDLRDVRTALQADLSMDGIKALGPTVKKVDKQAASVNKTLHALVAQFRELGMSMSRTGPPPPQPEPSK